MKKLVFLCCLLYLANGVIAQNVIAWQYKAIKQADKIYEVRIVATINSGWHIYSQTTPAGGPVATNIKFNKNPLVTTTGKMAEVGKLQTKFEEVFGVNTKFYSDKVEFVQTVKLKTITKTKLTGSLEFMVCSNEQCLPPATNVFSIVLE